MIKKVSKKELKVVVGLMNELWKGVDEVEVEKIIKSNKS